MKAHIAALPPATALAWKVPEDSALDKVCAGAGVRLRTVKEEDLGRTVAALCGLPGRSGLLGTQRAAGCRKARSEEQQADECCAHRFAFSR